MTASNRHCQSGKIDLAFQRLVFPWQSIDCPRCNPPRLAAETGFMQTTFIAQLWHMNLTLVSETVLDGTLFSPVSLSAPIAHNLGYSMPYTSLSF